jgi:hypothetical protein
VLRFTVAVALLQIVLAAVALPEASLRCFLGPLARLGSPVTARLARFPGAVSPLRVSFRVAGITLDVPLIAL